MNMLKRSTALALLALALQSNAVVYAAAGAKATQEALQAEIEARVAADETLADSIANIDSLPVGANPGDILYWDGSAWQLTPAPIAGCGDPVLALKNNVPTWTDQVGIYCIGRPGPAGGIVFYATDGGLHGLEAAPEDQANTKWCSTNTDIAGVDNITSTATSDSNSGAINTPLIVAACATSAAAVAANYVWPDGQTGGFLPNKEELNDMYVYIGQGGAGLNVGGFATGDYWSSSEDDKIGEYGDGFAWAVNFDSGS